MLPVTPASAPLPPSGWALLAVGLLWSTSACSSGADASPTLDNLSTWSLEPELRIGSVDDPDYAFSAVGELVVAPDGSIFSMHREPGEVRMWRADGQPAGSLGRSGQGPGEFTSPRAMGWQGDSLWVFDTGNSRISFFDAGGEFLGDVSARFEMGSAALSAAGVFPPRPWAPLADGSLLGETPLWSDGVVRGEITEQSVVRMSESGEVLDTLTVLPVGHANTLGVLRDGGGTFTSQPFGDFAWASLVEDGSALIVLERTAAKEPAEAEFRLTKVDLEGREVWTRGYAYEPRPLPADTVASEVLRIAGSLHEWVGERTGTTLAQWEGWVREAMYVPAHFPPVSRISQGRDGTIWLELSPQGPDGPEWLVVAANGDPVERVRLPEGLDLLEADRDAVWGVEHDELEVPYIVRYRIAR